MDPTGLIDDLAAEQQELDGRLAGRPEEDWATPAPAAGWDVRDCVGHLCYFDETARLALVDPAAFDAHRQEFMAAPDKWRPGRPDEEMARSLAPANLLARWRAARAELIGSLRSADPGVRVPWYGPAMSLASFATARLMETWAHGQDIADALGTRPVVSDRLRHVCHIGVGARRYSYLAHQMEDPGDPVRVEVAGPGGDRWVWGPEEAADRVEGTALDFALVVTQRRHPGDTGLVITGPVAEQWLSIAQSFAGPAGAGAPPGRGRVQA